MQNRILLGFSHLDKKTEPIVVKMSHVPIDSVKVIGRIYQYWSRNKEDTAILYRCTNNNGEEICRPTTDFNTAERAFEKYAHQLDMQKRLKETARIRQRKLGKSKGLQR